MRRALLLVLLAALLVSVAAAAQPYTTAHFELYDLAGAGQSYLQSLGSELESAYSALAGGGVRLAPPCSGPRYTVYVKSMSAGEGGYVSWQYSYDSSGRITSSCIRFINFSSKLSGSTLKKTVYHEMVHVAQAAYFSYHSVVQAYPWYVEASAEGVAGRLTGVCTWESNFYSASLFSRNPYSYSDGDAEAYSYSAFFNWLLASYSVSDALSRTLSSSTVQNGWLNEAYTSYLLSIVKGQVLCGKTYTPTRQSVYLSSGDWSTVVSLDGLSAAYYAVQLTSSGIVEIRVEGASLRSNLKLNEPFEVQNTTLFLALVNPSASSISARLTVSALPMLSVELSGGVYDAVKGVLSVDLRVTYALKPVSGSVRVNGTEYQAADGLVSASFSGVGWGSYSLVVEYGGYSRTVRVNIAQPSFSAVTRSPLYLSPSGYGSLVLQASNSGEVSISAELLFEPQAVDGAEILKLASSSVALTIPPSASQRVEVPFTAGKLAEGEVLVKLRSASGEAVVAKFRVVPVELLVSEAAHTFPGGLTRVKLFVPQLNAFFEASFTGLSGDAVARYDTYAIGRVPVQLPPLSATVSAEPKLVAPSWALLRLSVALRAAGACPAYPVTYSASVIVNATALGSASFKCGEQVKVEGDFNATQTSMRATLVVSNQWVAEVSLTPPQILLEPSGWLITDQEVTVNVSVSVRGPYAYYILGRVFENSTEHFTFSAEAGSRGLEVDAGFSRQFLQVPAVKLSIEAPDVVLAPGPLTVKVVVESEASIAANLTVKLNGSVVASLSVRKNGTHAYTSALQLQPPAPGLYRVEVGSWFANSSALVYYVEAAGVRVEAPVFLLVGMPANVTVEVYAKPPLPLPVSVNVEVGGKQWTVILRGNSSLLVESPASPSVAVLEARLLNHTSKARVSWDLLNLNVEGAIGSQDGVPILPSGPLRGSAAFSNGTRAAAKVLVNGVEAYAPPVLGRVELNLTATYLGVRNSTVITVYVVPEGEYLTAADLVKRLREGSVFEQLLREAVRTGGWSEVAVYTAAYTAAKARADSLDPLGYVALAILEKGASEGNPALAGFAESLVKHGLVVYATLLVVCAAVVLVKVRKRRA
ncbi:MAG: hypothetical protein QXX83_00015 [Thermofilum sp.]